MGSNTLRSRPRTKEFRLEDLQTPRSGRQGYYAEIFEELKALAPAGKGLVIEFASDSSGGSAIKRLAGWGLEDGWSVFQQKVAIGKGKATRYVWVTKFEEEE